MNVCRCIGVGVGWCVVVDVWVKAEHYYEPTLCLPPNAVQPSPPLPEVWRGGVCQVLWLLLIGGGLPWPAACVLEVLPVREQEPPWWHCGGGL